MSDTKTLPQTVALPVAERWYAHGLHFNCTQCGNCCSGGPGYVWLTTAEMQQIADFLQLPFDTFTKKYVRHLRGNYSLTERPDYDCIFLRRAGGKSMCSIYSVRPAQCRTWPFWEQNLESPQHWANAAGRCPGMQDTTGPKHNLAHIEERRAASDS